MAEKKPNHICQYCHKDYYACPDCERNGSWREVACSTDCFKQLMVEPIIPEIEVVVEAKVSTDIMTIKATKNNKTKITE